MDMIYILCRADSFSRI